MPFVCPGKLSWPELVGVDAQVAVATIEKENPGVQAVIVKPYGIIPPIFSCARVVVNVDCDYIVRRVPVVG
ncbi:hypothetical protein CDL12_28768 [Handroanthus impetiginosus]|uniref:Uncharacterized protein n=1 Tax=Handroanthus impetiginosus TaxID=429701 RepID=A0A2G9G0E0_9LAMI|nr:hypothetical protein CDL12_28768 [Handroanthus impetiginosus]